MSMSKIRKRRPVASSSEVVKGLNVEALQTQAWWNQAYADGFVFMATALHTFNSQTPAVAANAATQLTRAKTAGFKTMGYARPTECIIGGLNGLTSTLLNDLDAVVLDVEAETDTTHPVTQAMVNMLTYSGFRGMIYTIAGDWNTIMSSSTAFSSVDLWDRYIIPGVVPVTMLHGSYYYLFGGWNASSATTRKIWQIDDPYTEQGTAVGLDYANAAWLNNNTMKNTTWVGWQFVTAPTATNLTTDYTRALGTSGDGLAVGSSCGFWPAATNRCVNGGADTNTTGATAISSTVTRITTAAKFFTVGSTPSCYNIATSDAAANEGMSFAISGGAASTQYTISFWAKASSGSPTIIATINDNVSGDQSSSPVILTTSWQKITKTATTGAGSVTWLGKIQTNTQQNVSFQVDGIQIETGPVATPYIVTDGGTAARTASLLTLTVGTTAFDETQSWIAFRVVPRWATTNEPYGGSAFPRIFTWRTDNNNGFFARYNESGNSVSLLRGSGGTFQTVTQAWTPVSGTSATIIFSWDASNIYVSVNGAARTSIASASIPTVSNTFMDILSLNASENFAGEAKWVAWGTGTISDADCTTINAFGDTPPTPASFSTANAVNGIYAGFINAALMRTTAL